MTRYKQHRAIRIKRLLGAVAVVYVDVDNGDAGETVLGLENPMASAAVA
jgi:hypothetical protein